MTPERRESLRDISPVPKPVILVDPPRREWIRTLPCAVCQPGEQTTPTECAHVHTCRHGDQDGLVPLCVAMHRTDTISWHNGQKTFEAHYRISLAELGVLFWKRYDREVLGL